MTKVLEVSRKDLSARRAAILKELGLSLEELRAKAATYSLSPNEISAWEEIGEINFLLGETS
jgi:hypothetical protein